MGDHRFRPIHRSNPDNGNRSDQRPQEVDRLTVAVVEDDVFGREVDVKSDDAVPSE